MENKIINKELFESIESSLGKQGFTIANKDLKRPWGGFFVINESQSEMFAKTFFGELQFKEIKLEGKLSPKILFVAPDKRLSWQYHLRRAEIWKVLQGEANVITSFTDQEGSIRNVKCGNFIQLKQGERHRLVGLKDWCVVAEIWQHTSIDNPSDEEDIIRIQDDFGR